MMKISELAAYWQKLEATTSRNEMMQLLASLLKTAGVGEVAKVCYLSLGRLGPLFANVEFNLAEKLMIKGLALAYKVTGTDINRAYKQTGDLGLVAEEFATRNLKFEIRNLERENLENFAPAKIKQKRWGKELDVVGVYKRLLQIAQEEGDGSQERKLQGIAELLRRLDPLSARYVVRIPLQKMRLGFSDKTILDALSFMQRGDKSGKKELEEVYKVRPDIGSLAQIVKERGIRGVSKLKQPKVGVPILMAKAQRMSSAAEIIAKIGSCAVEPKIDGFRLQIHLGNSKVKLFTRNLDDVTHMYPDIVEGVQQEVEAETAIFEGEAVAFNPRTGEFLPFQETVQRKRKYEIAKFAKEVPLKLIAFDCLYLNGRSLLSKTYEQRRRSLEQIIRVEGFIAKKQTQVRGKFSNTKRVIELVEKQLVTTAGELEALFEKAVSRKLEGVMAKRLDAPYQAGARNWNWIKYKKSYSAKLADSIDCLVMGYDAGKGKRAKFGIGAFLVGVYDAGEDVFRTVSKIGTGLTDQQWMKLKQRCEKVKVAHKEARYKVAKEAEVDVWVAPRIVVEIEADEITKSPVHTAGLALRFPRLKRFRDDKRPEQATTLQELRQMYQRQRNQKATVNKV